MAAVYSQHELSEDATLSSSSRKPKSLRKLFSKKLFTKSNNQAADRTDASTSRHYDFENSGREQPTSQSIEQGESLDQDWPVVEEREISALNDKGNEFFGKNEFDAALRMYSEALKLLKNSNIITDSGDRNEQAEENATKVLEMSLRSSKLVPQNSSHYYRASEVMADAMENIGLVLFKQKDYERASAMYGDALVARQKCIDLLTVRFKSQKGSKSKEAMAKYQEEKNACKVDLANTLFYTALLRERQGHVDEAFRACEDAILLRREVFPDLKTDAASLSLLSTIGRLYCHESVQRYEDALGYFHEVHRMKCELFGKRHLGVASSLNSIAFIYLNLGDYDKCVVISDRAIDIASNGRGLNKEMCVAWTNKGDAQEKLGQYVDAVASYEKVLDLQSACLSEDDIANAEVYEKMADSYLSMNDIQQATSSLEDAILVKIEALGDENEELAKSYRKLAECYEMTQDYSNSIKSHTRALRIFKHIGDKEGAAIEHNKMGGILKKSGDYNKAMEHYMASLWHSREAKLPSTNPIVADTIRNVASFQTN
ncbi:predicted protein [Thalassiosira pseudonana CCMP1335]|uniref:Uncharacterized protein n=1 Tax=Thalassiosira pseudonana TaxID=35128 RepID=B5YME6_THAPS|nr:predicted protein [Thalassiosira pseudonana CCMP1335]ACI64446.1 predicted protein [Thalassiosira pseudonana CCMP1335]